MSRYIKVVLIFSLILFCKPKSPVDPDKPCIDDQPVEDTTRVWLLPLSRDTLWIYPKMVFARFYPWVQDSAKIVQLLEKHHLELFRDKLFGLDQQLAAWLCVTDDRRAEYHFTPYGKENFCNFGADSLVEYAFGVFDNGRTTPNGRIDFRFEDGTTQTLIDSLFEVNGLRFLYTRPDFPSGKWYRTLITHKADKNILDLAFELQSIPFARFVILGLSLGASLHCD